MTREDDPQVYPKRSVYIKGSFAKASLAHGIERYSKPKNLGPIDITPQFRTVKSAEDADKELRNPGDAHHCGLCNEFFGWEMFKAHAPQCIEARAPRNKVWVPAGTKGALAVYSEKINLEGSRGV